MIAQGGVGVTISSQSVHRMKQLTPEEDEQLAITPTEELLNLEILQVENIKDTLHAYKIAKRCNEKRVMAESVKWGERGARINSISPGILQEPKNCHLYEKMGYRQTGKTEVINERLTLVFYEKELPFN